VAARSPSAARSDVRSLIASIERTPIATVVTDPRLPDNPIIAANRAFLELTGYAMAEVVGRNCRFLAGEETDPAAQSRLRRAIADGRPAMVEVINYRKDASAFCNAVMVAPILDATGEVMLFVGSQMEVGDQGRAGDRQARAAGRIGRLTRRQRQVLERIVRGHRNKQIANALGIGESTVKMHRADMLARLGCATSADAIRLGVEAGLAEI
jgi:PAS domain S-box-containing protein